MSKNKKTEEQFNEEDVFLMMSKGVGGEILEERDRVNGFIDTGVLSLNFALSGKYIGGGVPIGACIEAYGSSSSGKTLFGCNVLRGCQTANGIAVFLDAEHTISKEFAVKASHIDPKKMIIVESDTLEKAFAKIHKVIRWVRQDAGIPLERPLIIVYDSIAVSPSEREFAETTIDMETATKASMKEVGAGSDKPGERAKIVSKELRNLPPVLAANNASIIFLNQIREKIGVMFGCFSSHSKVMLADGSWEKISKIVNNKLPVEVMSFDLNENKFSPKKVVGWHRNGFLGKDEKFLNIKFSRMIKNVTKGNMFVTKNHSLFVLKDGEIKEMPAGNIKVGDKLLATEPKYLDEDHLQIVYGSILGDGHVDKEIGHNASLRLGHGPKQAGYLKYKAEMFGDLAGKIHQEGVDRKIYCDTVIPEINKFSGYTKDYIIHKEISDNLNELGLAIWYLDDGTYGGYHEKWGSGKSTIYCKKWNNREVMLPILHKLGLSPTLTDVGFVFDAENTMILHQKICRFVPPCMCYKLHPRFWHLFDYSAQNPKLRWEKEEGEVLSISDWYSKDKKGKFDLTIADNGNYVVGGALVHNSNETTTSGRGIEFYCSQRIKMSGAKTIKDSLNNTIGININIRNTKNKVAPPFKEVRGLRLFFDKGIDPFGGLLEVLLQDGRIEQVKAGSYAVKEPWADGKEIKFKSAKERNDVPSNVLLECPGLVDATSKDQVQYYIDMFGDALNAVEHDIDKEEDFTDDE